MNPRILKIKNLSVVFFRKPRVSLGIFIIFLLVAALFSGYASKNWLFNKKSDLAAIYSVGDEIQTGLSTLIIHGSKIDTNKNDLIKPKEGFHFVLVDFTLINTSEKSIELVPLIHFHLRDSEGRVYQVAAVASETDMWSGVLLAHDKIRENIGFEVRTDAVGLTLYFETGTPKREIARIKL